MRISLRTSGGRGEYELAGRQRNVKSSDIYDREIDFEITPDLILHTYTILRHIQGKPRIRIIQGSGGLHSYALIAAILLLPKPIREFRKTSTFSDVIHENAYSIVGIDVDVIDFDTIKATLRPKMIYASNTLRKLCQIDVAERMARISWLWNISENSKGKLAELIISHRDAVLSPAISHVAVYKCAQAILGFLNVKDSKAVDSALDKLGEKDDITASEEIRMLELSQDDETWTEMEADDTTAKVSARQQIFKWRYVATRGKEGKKFSDDVKNAYNFTCLFSGQRMPRIDEISSSGVEAAHILPWARHRINAVQNGICLNKLMHWAFDAGLIRLDWDKGKYSKSIPKKVSENAKKAGFDLSYFLGFEGSVKEEYLPVDRSNWPEPEFICELNRKFFE